MNNLFIKTYLKILQEATFSSFSELNPKDFVKSNENFPEGNNIDITSYFDNLIINQIKTIILLDHCIKSENGLDIHGINYMNIEKERFIEVVSKCLNYLLSKRTIFSEQDVRFNINDKKLKSKFTGKEGISIKHNDKGLFKKCQ